MENLINDESESNSCDDQSDNETESDNESDNEYLVEIQYSPVPSNRGVLINRGGGVGV